MSGIVHAVIVEKPNKDVEKWIKVIILMHTVFTLYTAYSYELHQVPEYRWWSLLISWLFLGVFVPLIGVRASERADRRRLYIFSGIQMFIGVCNVINFLAFTVVLLQVVNWCSSEVCRAEFETRNQSCLVIFANDTLEMNESYCEDIYLNMGTAVGFALLAMVSCMGGLSARKMNEVKLAEVTYVERVSVTRGMPSVPEDDETVLVSVTADELERVQ